MKCSKCYHFVEDDRLFCPECGSYLPYPKVGIRATILQRATAHILTGMLNFIILNLMIRYEHHFAIQLSIMLFYILLIGGFFTQGLTPGKYIMRLRVIDVRTHRPAGLWTMVLRDVFGKFISGMAFYLGYLWILIDPNFQTWHDRLAHTVVVREVALNTSEAKQAASA